MEPIGGWSFLGGNFRDEIEKHGFGLLIDEKRQIDEGDQSEIAFRGSRSDQQ